MRIIRTDQIILFLAITIYLLVMTACDETKELDDWSYSIEDSDIYVYDIDEQILLYNYTVNNNGDMIFNVFDYSLTDEIDELGIPTEKSENYFYTYNLSGELGTTEIIDLKCPIIKLIASGDNIYYFKQTVSTDNSNSAILCVYNSKTDEWREIYEINRYDLTSFKRLILVGDYLYFFARDIETGPQDYKLFDPQDLYINSGETLVRVDIENGKEDIIFTDNPIAWSKTTTNNILIYAYDSKSGYHFIEYDTTHGTFGEKIYTKLSDIAEFEIYDSDNSFIYLNKSLVNSNKALCATSPDSKKGIVQVLPDVNLYGELYYKNGYVFVKENINSKNVMKRFKLSDFIHYNQPINLISAEKLGISPFGCGYNILSEYPGYEGFALRVLAGDKDYDICQVYSTQDFSNTLKENGLFYPLNELTEVQNYINSCFDYIKDAATIDGNIWMLPISINVPFLIYNKDACREVGLDFENGVTYEQLADFNTKNENESKYSEKYNYFGEYFRRQMIFQYTSKFDSFDTNEFRSLAELIKNKFNYTKGYELISHVSSCNDSLINGYLDYFLFDSGQPFMLDYKSVINNDRIGFSSLPKLYPDVAAPADISFIVVNPNSDNLDETLNYIRQLAKYLMDRKDLMVFSDITHYKQT